MECYSEYAEISNITTSGDFGGGLQIVSYTGNSTNVVVRDSTFTQTSLETPISTVYLCGEMTVFFINVSITGGEKGGIPIDISDSAKLYFESGEVRANRKLTGHDTGAVILEEGVGGTAKVGYYVYDASTVMIDGASIPHSRELDYLASSDRNYLYGNYMTITSGLSSSEPVIMKQPTDRTVNEGKWVGFNVAALGPGLNYEWQIYNVRSGTGKWSKFNYSGKTNGVDAAAFGFSSGSNMNNRRFRCRIWNSNGSVYTNEVTCTLLDVFPYFMDQPEDKTVIAGETASFWTACAGGHLQYQWYYRTSSSGTWKECTGEGCDDDQLYVEGKAYRNGYQYRLHISNSVGETYSRIVKLTVLSTPSFTKQPASVSISAGGYASFVVKATGGNLSYQWYYRTSSAGSWKTCSAADATTTQMTVEAKSYRNGYQYRCRVSNFLGYKYSKAATLTVTEMTKPAITTQPSDKTASAGQTVKFTVKATGGSLSYQWYYRKSSSGSWAKCSGDSATTASLSVEAKSYRDGYQYRCKVSNDYGYVYTNTVTLKTGN